MMIYFPELTEARHLGGFRVELAFDDGLRGVVDLEHELHGPVFEPMRADPAAFAAFRIDPDWHTLAWPNGADLSPRFLWERTRLGQGERA